MDTTSSAGTADVRRPDSTDRRGRPRAGGPAALALALLLGVLAALAVVPAQHLRSFRDGVRAEATRLTGGPCMAGGCAVAFEVDGRTVEARLPAGSGSGRLSPAGTRVPIRYRADDPQQIAREEDLDGGGPAVFAAASGAGALFFAVVSACLLVGRVRRRRTEPLPGRRT
ncbi:hypothetical protein ABTX80_30145 [Streptomyces erythrochromogenes]|uniref:hypothetical protein n=1 Tax=Streptomyces erythrochromogenes TaxID=285574 RepID=UPI00331F045E